MHGDGGLQEEEEGVEGEEANWETVSETFTMILNEQLTTDQLFTTVIQRTSDGG